MSHPVSRVDKLATAPKLDVQVLISAIRPSHQSALARAFPPKKRCSMCHVAVQLRQLARPFHCFTALLLCCCYAFPAAGQIAFDQPPIDYTNSAPNDRIAGLQAKIDSGEVQLDFEEERGYLRSVLHHLNIPISTQSLVFSKTSFQLRRITPRTPRALYFNDDVYIGWVIDGDVIEVSAVDPQLGANFYTLEQRQTKRPKFTRRTHACLQCHGSTLTEGVPGHLVRSVYPNEDGHPILSARTFRTDHSSPLEQRWGGWYVTGEHGKQRHLGNLLVRDSKNPEKIDTNQG
ncbi:hypothetical protein ACFL2H_11195, partial [Planctomycetota bacterium]